MKKPFPKMILRILLVCVLLLGFLYMDDDIGTSAANLESDIRNLQKIPEDWIVEGDVSDTMAAYISYPQDRSDHTFSVYVNRPGLSFGYFFRGGGSLSGVERGIAEFTVDGYNERAFISMNHRRRRDWKSMMATQFKSSILTTISRLRSSYPQILALSIFMTETEIL